MRYIDALRKWNEGKADKMWCSPKKGSPEHAEVIGIMNGTKIKDKAASVLQAVVKRKLQEPKKTVKKPTNLLDLPNDALNIIGEKVKKDNEMKMKKETEENEVGKVFLEDDLLYKYTFYKKSKKLTFKNLHGNGDFIIKTGGEYKIRYPLFTVIKIVNITEKQVKYKVKNGTEYKSGMKNFVKMVQDSVKPHDTNA